MSNTTPWSASWLFPAVPESPNAEQLLVTRSQVEQEVNRQVHERLSSTDTQEVIEHEVQRRMQIQNAVTTQPLPVPAGQPTPQTPFQPSPAPTPTSQPPRAIFQSSPLLWTVPPQQGGPAPMTPQLVYQSHPTAESTPMAEAEFLPVFGNAMAAPTVGSVFSAPIPLPANVLSLQHWGDALIMFGKKHRGKTYRETFETDAHYVEWTRYHAKNARPPMQDFINYAKARKAQPHLPTHQVAPPMPPVPHIPQVPSTPVVHSIAIAPSHGTAPMTPPLVQPSSAPSASAGQMGWTLLPPGSQS